MLSRVAAFPPLRLAVLFAPPVLGLAAVLLLVIVVAFGALPIWPLRSSPAEALRSGPNSVAGGAGALRGLLLALQAGLSFALVSAVFLFAASLHRADRAPSGMDAAGVHAVALFLNTRAYPDQAASIPLFRRLLTAARRLPGVSAAGLGNGRHGVPGQPQSSPPGGRHGNLPMPVSIGLAPAISAPWACRFCGAGVSA